MCDTHIAPKKFNEIAFGAEKQLASSAVEVASTVCAEVGVVFIQISANSLQNPSVIDKPRHRLAAGSRPGSEGLPDVHSLP